MSKCKKDVTPLLTNWSSIFIAPTQSMCPSFHIIDHSMLIGPYKYDIFKGYHQYQNIIELQWQLTDSS